MRSSIPNAAMMTRCVTIETDNGNNINNKISAYDGWHMIYVSEYTTGNKASSAAVMCFEKPTTN